jgi:hypothetical protein
MASKKFSTENADVLAECNGKRACHQNVMASRTFSTSPPPGNFWYVSTLPIKIQVKFMTDPGPSTILSQLGAAIGVSFKTI